MNKFDWLKHKYIKSKNIKMAKFLAPEKRKKSRKNIFGDFLKSIEHVQSILMKKIMP